MGVNAVGTIVGEIDLEVPASVAWDAVADVGNVHLRLVPGFVTNTTLVEGVRTVTFANGIVLKEAIVAIDADLRRIAYGSVNGRATHHNASLQVVPTGDNACRLIWITDVLPENVVPYIRGNVDAALPIMKATIEKHAG
jgi:hypothetical protein